MLFHRIIPVLVSGCFLLTGCGGNERMCNGFYHPLAEIWTENNGLGELRTFAGSDGSQKNYVLESISRSEPRIEVFRGSGESSVGCIENEQYLYVESNSDLGFNFYFLQDDTGANSTIENQPVSLYVDVQNPVGTPVDAFRLVQFQLNDLEQQNQLGGSDDNSPLKISYIPETTINGVVYTDLLQHEFIDNSNRFTRGEVVDDAKWVRMLLAKNVGLLQYELLNGEVFTLVRN